MNKNHLEFFGWYGMCAIIIAYALISFSVISSESLIYHILNGTGALGIAFISFNKKAFQSGILNIMWALIAVIAIVRIFI